MDNNFLGNRVKVTRFRYELGTNFLGFSGKSGKSGQEKRQPGLKLPNLS